MAHVVIKTLVFAPDGVSTATIVSELAKDLKQKGHTISVITTTPHYNKEPEAIQKQPLTKRLGGLYYTSTYETIPIWHTAVTKRGRGMRNRLIGFFLYNLIGFFITLFRLRKIDVILVVSPPLTSGVTGWLLKLIKRAKLIYNVQELYPDTYIEAGSLHKESLVAKILFRVEQLVYNRSDILSVIGDVFKNEITSKGIKPEKIKVIPNFVDTERLIPKSKDNTFAMKLGLSDKFVLLYAGNIGMTQSFITILEAAKALQEYDEIRFLIVGDGVWRDQLEEAVENNKLNNVILKPYQSLSVVPDIYATGDVGLVPLMKGTARTTLPSKLYTIMATGTPVLAAVDEDSDIVTTVEKANAGICVSPDDTDALREGILYLYQHREKLKVFSENGRQFAVNNYSRQIVASQYDEMINTLMD